jgi:hypothetical protein
MECTDPVTRPRLSRTGMGTMTLGNPTSESGAEEYDDECAAALRAFS